MFARRKPQDGFEWQRYVRTTVRLRRALRRRRFEEAQQAARRRLAATPRALAAGAYTGLSAALAWVAAATVALAAVIGGLALRCLDALRPAPAALLFYASRGWRGVCDPALARPIAFAGAIVLAGGIVRLAAAGGGIETAALMAIGAALLAPEVARRTGRPGRPGPGPYASASRYAGLTVALLAGLAVLWVGTRGSNPWSWITARLGLGGGAALHGKAHALSGDTLRVGGKTVRLAGVVSDTGPHCGKTTRRTCGAAARAVLSRLVSGQEVRCFLAGRDREGRVFAACSGGGKDLAAELVRQGVASAEPGLRGAAPARGGERTQAWEEAKRRAPGGCPIKGLVRREGRIYVLPGEPSYALRRVREARGERWFCSEHEAQAAGFKAVKRG
jgi:hypothetical protein